jgi:hypothetical protein
MSIGYHIRRMLTEHRLRRALRAAEYSRAMRCDAEAAVAMYDREVLHQSMLLAQLERRADLARMGGA